jgi:N-methylhydantoinase A
VVLGHFGGSGLLGGEFKLDEESSRKAMVQLARDMSKAGRRKFTPMEAALGVIAVANTNMERALRRISVERGYDTREFALLPFGGAGGLHAVDLARALRIPQVIIPKAAGALSAVGVLMADVVKDQSRTIMLGVGPGIEKSLDRAFTTMDRTATGILRREGFSAAQQRHERSLALRYKGQSFEIEIKETDGNIVDAFHRAHRERYGYAQESNTVEVVSARLRSVGVVEKMSQKSGTVRRRALVKPLRTTVSCIDGKESNVAVYSRDELQPGVRLRTPCIVTEYSSTTLIPTSAALQVDAFGNLILNVETIHEMTRNHTNA